VTPRTCCLPHYSTLLAARLLDDRAEEEVAGVVVLVLLAGLELHGLVLEVIDELLDRGIPPHAGEEVVHVGDRLLVMFKLRRTRSLLRRGPSGKSLDAFRPFMRPQGRT